MKKIHFLALIVSLLLLSTELAAAAQTRPRQTTPRRRAPAARASSTAAAATADAARAAARRNVAEQVKLLTRFLYLFGRISSGIETADEQARQQQQQSGGRAQASQVSQRSKQALIENLRNVRAGLDKLENDLRGGGTELAVYYSRIQGAAASIGAAEQLVANSQLDQASRTLLTVVNRLADLLAELR